MRSLLIVTTEVGTTCQMRRCAGTTRYLPGDVQPVMVAMIRKNDDVSGAVSIQMGYPFEYFLSRNRHCVRSWTGACPMRRNAPGRVSLRRRCLGQFRGMEPSSQACFPQFNYFLHRTVTEHSKVAHNARDVRVLPQSHGLPFPLDHCQH